ncbi:MAG: PilZ domain-containing protein [Candidatus Omnitrophica bacterium]|nr:PilZ domain-containing protein [Candidatus Omnitrophota bacterium]
MEERRIYPRMRVGREAAVTIENRVSPLLCTVEDISLSGVRLTMAKNLLSEVFSNISLAISDALSVDLGAHVAWQSEYEGKNTYGLHFNRINDSDRDKLAEYIRDNSFKELREQWWKGL